ncbi:MAG: hypothetical protein KDI63_03180 [Gammaproteobacteria bacterium]|nr:hypothetical protein [Gammaproteobacteria bacterium]
MWFTKQCCGGLVLAMSAWCMGVGLLLMGLSAYPPAVAFMVAGTATIGLCLMMGRSRCRGRVDRHQATG